MHGRDLVEAFVRREALRSSPIRLEIGLVSPDGAVPARNQADDGLGNLDQPRFVRGSRLEYSAAGRRFGTLQPDTRERKHPPLIGKLREPLAFTR